MRSNFEEKRENRVARFERLAQKFSQESESRYKRFHDLLSVIPMGQPILVGHHSERGHRALLNKADNAMRASVEADKKSAYYADRAEAAETNNAISSDDPQAIEKLQAKLDALIKNQELMKACNKIAKGKKTSQAEKVELLMALGLKESTANEILIPHYGRVGIQGFKLTNNNANISTVRKRLEHLKKIEAQGNEEKTYGDIRVFANADENRVQIFFLGIPAEEIRKALKGYGYRWTPSVGCWQAYYSNRAKWSAIEIVKLTQKQNEKAN